MIRLIEALNYRCLRYVRQELADFQILVGPNASGKSTFMDIPVFLGGLIEKPFEDSLAERSDNFLDLVWGKAPERFELAMELEIPKHLRARLSLESFKAVRYEIAIGYDRTTEGLAILEEQVIFKESHAHPRGGAGRGRRIFADGSRAPRTLITPFDHKGTKTKTVVQRLAARHANYYPETRTGPRIRSTLGPLRPALRYLPDEENRFPVSTWLMGVLIDGLRPIALNPLRIRMPSPPGRTGHFIPDGSILPWAVWHLQKRHPDQFNAWVDHLRTALPDLETVLTTEKPEDRTRYLTIRYRNKLEVPSWVVSDGTLRLLALTIIAYLPEPRVVWLIEEPENGIHPTGVTTVFDSLHSVYEGQVLLATHSPVILSLAEAPEVLCFAKNVDGATSIIRGDQHPQLRDWKGEENLGVLFAGGVLG